MFGDVFRSGERIQGNRLLDVRKTATDGLAGALHAKGIIRALLAKSVEHLEKSLKCDETGTRDRRLIKRISAHRCVVCRMVDVEKRTGAERKLGDERIV